MMVDKIYLSYCLLFMFNLGKCVSKAFDPIYQVYGEMVIYERTCHDWFAKFKKIDLSFKRQATDRQTKRICRWGAAIIVARRWNAIDHKAFKSQAVDGDALPTCLRKDHNVGQWLGLCKALLQRFEWKNFFWKVVIRDEKWVHLDYPVSKWFWVDPDQPATSTAKSDFHRRKMLLFVCWDIHDILYFYFLESSETITAQCDSVQLMKLNTEIKHKHPMIRKRYCPVILDTIIPDCNATTKTTLEQL